MPSDDHAVDLSSAALEAVAPRVEAFRSGVATAGERLRAELADGRGAGEDRTAQVAEELGRFAEGRIDPERFAALFAVGKAAEPKALKGLEAASAVFEEFSSAGTDPFVAEVPEGGDLRDTVRDALTGIGRVLGAARVVELTRRNKFKSKEHGKLLKGFPFRRWNPGERGMAPPLVVTVEADDLQASGLGEYMDGGVKLVLVVKGETEAAPLAAVISPGVFVAQTAKAEVLQRLAESQYPGVALYLEKEGPNVARFVHDPAAGTSSAERLTIEAIPEIPKGRARGATKDADALAHLEALAVASSAGGESGSNGQGEEAAALSAAAPADRLAAWLLQQSDLS